MVPDETEFTGLHGFGPFLLDPLERFLLREGHRVALKPKVFDALLLLVRNAGHVLDRDELMRFLWPDAVVTDANLTQTIWMLRKALEDTEDAPRYVETVPRHGYRFMAAVSRVSREEATTLREQLRKEASEGPRRRWRRLLFGALALVLIASATAYLLRLSLRLRGTHEGETAASAAPFKPRRSVAVFGFKNLSPRRDEAVWLSTALAEWFTTELGASQKLRAIPPENVARAKSDLSLGDEESLAPSSRDRIRKILAADLLVLGSYVALAKEGGGRIRLDVRIEDAATGDLVAAVTGTGTEEGLFALVSDVGVRLRQELGVGELSAVEAATVRAALPSNPEAARLYAEGLAKLRVFDALTARDLLQKAVAADPEHALAHSALAAAWSALGYDAKAMEEAKRAFNLATSLSREAQLSVEGRYREATREWEKAIGTYRTLFGFFPDNLEYGLRLAEAQTSAGKGKDAMVTLEALRKLPRPASEDPRIDLAEARADESLAEFKRCQASAAKAAEKGAALGARLLVTQARFQEGRALMRLGDHTKASAAAQEAKRIFAEVGDRAGVARALNLSGILLWHQGELGRAKATWEETLMISRQIGNKDLMQRALNNVAEVLRQQGDLAGAKGMYEKALAIAREIGDKGTGAITQSNIAEVLEQSGDLAGSKRISEEFLATGREIDDKHVVAHALHNIATALRQQGDLAGAKRIYEEALSIRRQIGNKSESAETLHGLGDLLAAEGDLAAARKKYEEALALWSEMGATGRLVGTRLALATLFIEEGRPGEAETPARQAAEEFRTEKRPDDEASAHIVIARSLLKLGRASDAQEALQRALALSSRSQNIKLRLSAAITAAAVRAASGRSGEAIRDVETALSEATKAGLVGVMFDAGLVLGEIEVRSGNPAGSARLDDLEREARSRGFGLTARKAADTRRAALPGPRN